MFDSETPQETEEDEFDEEISIDGLDDVEKFLNEDDDSDFVLEEDERNFKRKTTSRFRKTIETSDDSRDAEVPRGSRGAEAENEMQLLRQCGTLGKRMSTKVVTRIRRRWKRERRISGSGVLETSHVFSLSSRSRHGWKGFADAMNNVVPCWRRQKKLRMERNQFCGEFETMLNSCPGKGIVGTGCAKSKRSSIHRERAREESVQVRRQRD